MTAIGGLGSQPLSNPLPLPVRFGRYRLTQLLAVGGMAQIYLAKSFGAEGFVKPLVIKRLDPKLADNPHFTRLFVNEAKLLVTLNHGNIVPVFDFGRVGDDLYMAMEYIPGASLRRVLQAVQAAGLALDAQLAAYIATEVCKGLDYAHRKVAGTDTLAGIIHRDIKPTNILISTEGEVKIVDFGVAKLAGRLERGGVLTGTLAYMSPEQAERLAVDPRTDIFSAGLVLYELVTGARAYQAEAPLEVLARARRAEIPALPEDTPRELQEIIVRATRRDPAERYSSAHEMEQALSEYLLLARSAGAQMDSVSPASKLSALMARLELEEVAKARAEAEEPSPPDDDEGDGPPGDGQMVSGLIEIQDPPDLALMRDAAETFHSEFMTRVLLESQEGPGRRWWLWAALAGGGALLLATAVVLALLLRADDDPAGRPRPGRALRPGAGGSSRDAGPAASADAAADRDAAKVRTSPERPATRPRRAAHGFLNLNTIPWSRVTIDGRGPGRTTPLLKVKLRSGWHTVVLENRERRLRKVVRVHVKGGATTWKVIRLR